MSQADLSILIIDENVIRASIIEEGLREAGHLRVTVIHEVRGVGKDKIVKVLEALGDHVTDAREV